jgi:glucuronokinase
LQVIRKRAFARAGLIGNPSDGYHGRAISISVRNFHADVVLYEWHEIELLLSQEDRSRFRSVHELVRDVELHGYYGGIRLVKAAIKKFVEYCRARGHAIDDRAFTVRYETNIPRQVGLAGSSAIIVATLRCLMEFYRVKIPLRLQPSLALSVESEELGIAAGLQDRVIQAYEGVVDMDFSPAASETIDGFECGRYERLDPQILPPLYVAYRTELSGPTEVVHNNLRERFRLGEPAVVQAMVHLAELVPAARQAIDQGDPAKLAELIDRNFEIRRSICQIPAAQVDMVLRARRAGASAKFAGSGGAIIGTFSGPEVFDRLQEEMDAIGCRLIRPWIVE